MLDYMFLPFRRYAEFRGRSRRMEFWAFGLFNLIVYAIIGAVVLATTGTLATVTDTQGGAFSVLTSVLFGGAGILFGIYWLATIIPALAVTVRRFHDRDMSGWWYPGLVVLSIITLIGIIASIAILVLLLLPGTPGANRYGADPKDPSSAEVFA